MSEEIVVYMTSWCPDCTRSRRVLQRAGVAFREIDIEEVAGAEEAMRLRNGGSGKVPTICLREHVLIEPSDKELSRVLEEVFQPTHG